MTIVSRGVPRPRLGRVKRLGRKAKSELTRRKLFHSAAAVVGQVGYKEATIAQITQHAGLAQGTFYTYFDSQQELFDQLLPVLGLEMLEFVSERVRGGSTNSEVEERGVRAFFDYLTANPGFLRILNEAETLAPKAYKEHFQHLSEHYVSSLKRSQGRGELAGYDNGELEVIAYMLMASRAYLAMRFAGGKKSEGAVPEWVIRTYMKFAIGGFNFPPGEDQTSRKNTSATLRSVRKRQHRAPDE